MRYTITHADLPLQHAAVVRGHVKVEEIPDFLGGAFTETMEAITRQGLRPAGAPFARYVIADDGVFEIEAGFPVNRVLTPSGRAEPSQLEAGRVARTVHHGPYSDVGLAYEALEKWVVENGYRATGVAWESYLDEPGVAEPRTEVCLPCVEAHL